MEDLGLAQVRQAASREEVKMLGRPAVLGIDLPNLRHQGLPQPETPGIIVPAGRPGVCVQVASGLGIIKRPNVVMPGRVVLSELRPLPSDPHVGQKQQHLPYHSHGPTD